MLTGVRRGTVNLACLPAATLFSRCCLSSILWEVAYALRGLSEKANERERNYSEFP